MRHSPDLVSVIHILNHKNVKSEALRSILDDHVDSFSKLMKYYHHENLRTYQFFLSKMVFLYNHCSRMSFQHGQSKPLMHVLVHDCFGAVLRIRGNISEDKGSIAFPEYQISSQLKFMDVYIHTGDYDVKRVKEDLVAFAERHFNDVLEQDDPYYELHNQFYRHDQKWIEEKLELMLKRLEDNQYPSVIYGSIVVLLLRLKEIGFDEIWLTRGIEAIRTRIDESDSLGVELSCDHFISFSIELSDELNRIFSELNRRIRDRKGQLRKKTIKTALCSNNWIGELEKCAKRETSEIYRTPFFLRAEIGDWTECLMKASPDQIWRFRDVIQELYLRGAYSDSLAPDRAFMKEMAAALNKKLEEYAPSDLMVKQCIRWVIGDLERLAIEG